MVSNGHFGDEWDQMTGIVSSHSVQTHAFGSNQFLTGTQLHQDMKTSKRPRESVHYCALSRNGL